MAQTSQPAPTPAPAPVPVGMTWHQRLHSYTWWVTVAGGACVLADAIFGWNLDKGMVEAFAGMISALFLGTSYVAAKKP